MSTDSAAPADDLLRVYSPLDGAEIGAVARTPPEEMAKRMEAAAAAQPAWGARSVRDRLALLKKCRDAFHARVDEVVDVVRKESGKPLAEIYGGEIIANLELFDFYLKHAAKILRDERVAINPINYPGKRGVIQLRALGTVGVLSSWNYPVALPMRAIVPALAAGNAVAFKPSVDATLAGKVIAEIFASALPADVFVVGYGGRHVSGAIIDRADKINFIGSVEVGTKIAARCGERLIPCSTELSGKDASIILADAPLERALNGVLWGAFTNAGQNCASIERLYVEEPVYDRVRDGLLERIGRLRQGDDIGPLRNEKQMRLVEQHVASARESGSRVLTGGERVEGTLYYPPTLIEVEDRDALFMTEETFGPTLPIVKVKSLDEAVEAANSVRYGLTASIWTGDVPRAQAAAPRLETGIVMINNCVFTGALAAAPWGGVKDTGHGVTNSKYGLLEMVGPHFVLTDGAKGAKETWWYPYGDDVLALMRAVTANLGGQLSAIFKLPGLLKRVLNTQV